MDGYERKCAAKDTMDDVGVVCTEDVHCLEGNTCEPCSWKFGEYRCSKVVGADEVCSERFQMCEDGPVCAEAGSGSDPKCFIAQRAPCGSLPGSCVDGMTCLGDDGSKTCKAILEVGDSNCDDTASYDCDGELVCDNDTCKTELSLGDVGCDDPNTICEAELVCHDDGTTPVCEPPPPTITGADVCTIANEPNVNLRIIVLLLSDGQRIPYSRRHFNTAGQVKTCVDNSFSLVSLQPNVDSFLAGDCGQFLCPNTGGSCECVSQTGRCFEGSNPYRDACQALLSTLV